MCAFIYGLSQLFINFAGTVLRERMNIGPEGESYRKKNISQLS